MSLRRRFLGPIACALLASAGVTGIASAQQGKYNWVGYGRGTVQTPNCGSYKMTINITVANGRAAGLFQQVGRQERNFDIPLQANGTFKGEAVVGGGNKMQVTGRISGDSGEILLDGYCKFGGTLKRA
jgi:hypothetical protein